MSQSHGGSYVDKKGLAIKVLYQSVREKENPVYLQHGKIGSKSHAKKLKSTLFDYILPNQRNMMWYSKKRMSANSSEWSTQ